MKPSYKNKVLRRVFFPLLVVGLSVLAIVFYQKKIRYNLVTISEDKVYNSGVVQADKLPEFVEDYKIKTTTYVM